MDRGNARERLDGFLPPPSSPWTLVEVFFNHLSPFVLASQAITHVEKNEHTCACLLGNERRQI